MAWAGETPGPIEVTPELLEMLVEAGHGPEDNAGEVFGGDTWGQDLYEFLADMSDDMSESDIYSAMLGSPKTGGEAA